MRRSLALLTAASLATPTVLLGPAASAWISKFEVKAVVDNERPDHRLTITVDATSSSGITRLDAQISKAGLGDVYKTTTEFSRISGTDKDGRWQAQVPLDVTAHPGLTEVQVVARDASGTRSGKAEATLCYPTAIEDFTATPDAIDIVDSKVAMSGRLLYREHAGATPKPASGADVTGDSLPRVPTDAQGRFTFVAEDTATPYVEHEGLEGPYCAVRKDAAVQVTRYAPTATDLRVTPAADGQIRTGTPIEVTGRLRWSGPKGTGDASYREIALSLEDATGLRPLVTGTTRRDGTFTLSTVATTPGRGTLVLDGGQDPFFSRNPQRIRNLTTIADTRLADFGASPVAPGRAHVMGRLYQWGPYGDLGLVDAPVVLEWSADRKKWTQRADATTGSAGDFTFTADVPGDGFWRARYAGDVEHAPATGPQTPALAYLPTSLSKPVISPSPVTEGATLTVKSRLSRQGTGAVTKGEVALEFSPDGRQWEFVTEVRVDAKGDAVLKAKATRDGYWRTRSLMTYTAKPSLSAAVAVKVRRLTAVRSFNASPEPVRKGRTLTVRGTLARHDASWRPAASGTQVVVYFKAKGATRWTRMAVVKTGHEGAFSRAFKAAKDGDWKAAYLGGSAYAPSESAKDYVDVR